MAAYKVVTCFALSGNWGTVLKLARKDLLMVAEATAELGNSVPTQHLVWEASSLPALLSYYSDIDPLDYRDDKETMGTSCGTKFCVISTWDNSTRVLANMWMSEWEAAWLRDRSF